MIFKAKSRNKWVLLDDAGEDDAQVTEVMQVGTVGCLVRCTDTGDDEEADNVTVTFVPGATLPDFIEGEPEPIEEDDDDDDDDDDD